MLGNAFVAEAIYYKITRDNLMKIADHYCDMVKNETEIQLVLVADLKDFNELMTITDNVFSIDKKSQRLLSQLVIRSDVLKLSNRLGITPNVVNTP